LIVDVRVDDVDLESGVIPGAVLLRRTELDAIVPLLGAAREAIVYCACPNEVSAARIALELRRRGVLKVRPLSGGVDAWLAAGHALERPRLERAA
jgi:rhodanese-related sulfurtransferase